MGKKKYLDEIENFFKKSPVVDYGSIEKIVRNKKKVKQYVKLIVSNLLKQGKIKRLAKGYYTSRDEVSLAVFCFKPSYLGLQDALSAHNLWEQETIPVIITTNKVRQGIRRILNVNVLIRRIDKKYIFGFEYLRQGDIYLPYSDIEKTFIDMIYFKQPLDEDIINNFREKINKKKLEDYLKKYPKRFRDKVMSKFVKKRFKSNKNLGK